MGSGFDERRPMLGWRLSRSGVRSFQRFGAASHGAAAGDAFQGSEAPHDGGAMGRRRDGSWRIRTRPRALASVLQTARFGWQPHEKNQRGVPKQRIIHMTLVQQTHT